MPASRLKVVPERPAPAPSPPEPPSQSTPSIFGRTMARMREAVQEQPERYRQLADRMILLGIGAVLLVAAYILIAAPS